MFEKEAEEKSVVYVDKLAKERHFEKGTSYTVGLEEGYDDGFKDGAEYAYNKANEWQTGEPDKKKEIFARTVYNCNLLAHFYQGKWRNIWTDGTLDFDKITMWKYTGFNCNGELAE